MKNITLFKCSRGSASFCNSIYHSWHKMPLTPYKASGSLAFSSVSIPPPSVIPPLSFLCPLSIHESLTFSMSPPPPVVRRAPACLSARIATLTPHSLTDLVGGVASGSSAFSSRNKLHRSKRGKLSITAATASPKPKQAATSLPIYVHMRGGGGG